MAYKLRGGWGVSLILSVGTIVIILVSMLVLSGNFSKLVTTIVKPRASYARPQINRNMSDAFKEGKINTGNWSASIIGDAKVAETATDNLRMDVTAGAASQNVKTKAARLVFNKEFDDKIDFRTSAVVYRPILKGDGTGQSGIAFSSTDNLNDEGASVVWRVSSNSGQTKSEIAFSIKAPDGTSLVSKAVPINSNVAVISLVRVNKMYRGSYHVGADTSGDSQDVILGEVGNASLGNSGRIRLLTNNAGTKDKNPNVVGRFDSVSVGWQDNAAPTPSTNNFSDSFANGAIAKGWAVNALNGTSVAENSAKNLSLSVPPGAVKNHLKQVMVTRKDPVIQNHKNFNAAVQVFRPKVTGDGVGAAGITFQSNTNVDDEAATVEWQTTKDAKVASKVVFSVRAPNGQLLEKSSVPIAENTAKVWLRVNRSADKYSAWYRIGDGDSDWKQIGSEENGSLGGDGKVALYGRNFGPKFPSVTTQFDTISGQVQK